jgi:glutaredoxin
MKYELVVYTMESCGYCTDFKKLLEEANIPFHDRDIYKHEKEFDMFVKITETEFVPSVMLIQNPGEDNEKTVFLSPTKEYNTIEEAYELIKGIVL